MEFADLKYFVADILLDFMEALDEPSISVLVSTRDRPDTLQRCVQSIIKQDYSNYEALILDNSPNTNSCENINDISEENIECIHINESKGVAGSRNWLMKRASGDIFVIIDDDAYFKHKNSLSAVASAFEKDVGIISFKIINHKRRGDTEVLLPTSQLAGSRLNFDQEFNVSYYQGGGHAVKRGVINECGYYRSNLVYGMEELDLSYRAIQNGWYIKYAPTIVVHHHPEPTTINSESTGHPELRYAVANRIYFSLRYLPMKYVVIYLNIWLAYLIIISILNKSITEFFFGISRGIKLSYSSPREPLNSEAIKYIKENHGRLYY